MVNVQGEVWIIWKEYKGERENQKGLVGGRESLSGTEDRVWYKMEVIAADIAV